MQDNQITLIDPNNPNFIPETYSIEYMASLTFGSESATVIKYRERKIQVDSTNPVDLEAKRKLAREFVGRVAD